MALPPFVMYVYSGAVMSLWSSVAWRWQSGRVQRRANREAIAMIEDRIARIEQQHLQTVR
eukprot:NODE_3496_length_548_cov_103.060120_g2958_i0.p4 GENE.NODE_3496_length_548_cov_103.060120_g2958_i0~~NODE_3496_length_548_cov_103.060120_g2958_i0.p4  ORF type:complete len:60 (-),score=5.23 NODE_3496_length_548_cov_103.060120_g2958_i0:287-466(-)